MGPETCQTDSGQARGRGPRRPSWSAGAVVSSEVNQGRTTQESKLSLRQLLSEVAPAHRNNLIWLWPEGI